MATWKSRGLRGSALEELINRTNEKYRDEGLALIQKIPTPITPIEIDQSTRRVVRPAIADSYKKKYSRLYRRRSGNPCVL